jgi:hypothetical protein
MTDTAFNEADHPREKGVFVDKAQSTPDLAPLVPTDIQWRIQNARLERDAIAARHYREAARLERLDVALIAGEILDADPSARYLILDESDQEGSQWTPGNVVDADGNVLDVATEAAEQAEVSDLPQYVRSNDATSPTDRSSHDWLIIAGTKRAPDARIDLLKAIDVPTEDRS